MMFDPNHEIHFLRRILSDSEQVNSENEVGQAIFRSRARHLVPQLEEWEQRGVIDGFLREDAFKQPLLAAACFEFATTETGTPFAVTPDGQYVNLEASRAANRRYDQVVIKLFMQETDFPGSVVDVEEGSLQNPDMRRDLTKIRLWLREGLINESEIPGLLSDMRHYRAALLNFSST